MKSASSLKKPAPRATLSGHFLDISVANTFKGADMTLLKQFVSVINASSSVGVNASFLQYSKILHL